MNRLVFGRTEHGPQADEYCEKVLDEDPECAQAYLYKMMISHKISTEEEISKVSKTLESDSNYKKGRTLCKGKRARQNF